MQSKYKQIKFEHSRRNSYRYNFLGIGITILNQRIIFGTPCISFSLFTSKLVKSLLYIKLNKKSSLHCIDMNADHCSVGKIIKDL